MAAAGATRILLCPVMRFFLLWETQPVSRRRSKGGCDGAIAPPSVLRSSRAADEGSQVSARDVVPAAFPPPLCRNARHVPLCASERSWRRCVENALFAALAAGRRTRPFWGRRPVFVRAALPGVAVHQTCRRNLMGKKALTVFRACAIEAFNGVGSPWGSSKAPAPAALRTRAGKRKGASV